MTDAIQVFVGSAPQGLDAESDMVLEYSLRKHCSAPVDIHWMRTNADVPWHGWNQSQWATPFSGFRWAVPAVNLFQGRAIYLDNDIVILADIAELQNADMQDRPFMARWPGRFCVSVFDCAKAKEVLPSLSVIKSDPGSHAMLQERITQSYIAKLDPLWNCLDGEDVPLDRIKALHFTDMSTQPAAELAAMRLAGRGGRNVSARPNRHWYDGERRTHRRPDCAAMFLSLFQEALDAGYSLSDYE